MSGRVLTVTGAGPAARRWADRVAALTRRAFSDTGEIAGLPCPDGAGDEAAPLLDELAAGDALWIALSPSAEITGAMRVTGTEDGSWCVHRVVVDPALRGGGVGRLLLSTLERAAADRDIPAIRLNAVVERGLPPLYARLGYRVTGLEPGPGKPLSELVMERSPGSPGIPAPLAEEWIWPALLPTVSWFVLAGEVYAVTGRHRGVADAARGGADALAAHLGPDAPVRYAGTDAHMNPHPADHACEPPAPGGLPLDTHITRYAGPRERLPTHVMPRTADPWRFAVWRYNPGREARIAPRPHGRAVPSTREEMIP
ncbi:GNAT family N-acetyltransferase [uncultured Streptomyces sp.]|uniref:GNAT family N-acetyltransferase n=1 Tax=uncultured Streptomyces sp. TaxID=174707 RepID=UPI0026086F3E|nr:GNAT family N-acetyltransferase [uncultured Streptomyces sp.]